MLIVTLWFLSLAYKFFIRASKTKDIIDIYFHFYTESSSDSPLAFKLAFNKHPAGTSVKLLLGLPGSERIGESTTLYEVKSLGSIPSILHKI